MARIDARHLSGRGSAEDIKLEAADVEIEHQDVVHLQCMLPDKLFPALDHTENKACRSKSYMSKRTQDQTIQDPS